jgi:hypothetical protein
MRPLSEEEYATWFERYKVASNSLVNRKDMLQRLVFSHVNSLWMRVYWIKVARVLKVCSLSFDVHPPLDISPLLTAHLTSFLIVSSRCAEDIETDMQLLGACGIEDELQDGVFDCINLLNKVYHVWFSHGYYDAAKNLFVAITTDHLAPFFQHNCCSYIQHRPRYYDVRLSNCCQRCDAVCLCVW